MNWGLTKADGAGIILSMKKLVVDEEKCIGCGTCVALAPGSFRLNEKGKSEPIEPPGESEEKIQEAIDSCPVGAIKWESEAGD